MRGTLPLATAVLALLSGTMLQVSDSWGHQWVPDGVPICTADDDQFGQEMVRDESGGAIITWTDYRWEAGVDTDIFAQRIDVSGATQWSANGVVVSAASRGQWAPRIAHDWLGGAVIAWRDSRNASGYDIYAQKVAGDGSAQWTTNGTVVCNDAAEQEEPSIVCDGAGGAIIAWRDLRNLPSGLSDIYAQRISSAGAAVWTANGIPICAWSGYQDNPEVVTRGPATGGAYVVWRDTRSDASGDIYAQGVDLNGSVLWVTGGKPVCTASGTQIDHQAVYFPPGAASHLLYVTWSDCRSGLPDIYAQALDPTGAPIWQPGEIPVSCRIGYQWHPQIISDGADGVIIVWEDTRDGNYDIYAQRLNRFGVNCWTQDGIPICTDPNHQTNPHLTSDGSGGAIITWVDERNGLWDIYAQGVNGSGNCYWATDGVAICAASDRQLDPRLVSDGTGGAIVTWTDRRNQATDDDIYAQRIDSQGNAPPAGRARADHDVGNILLTVTDRGIVGFLDATQQEGSGLVYPVGGENLLYIGSLWVGESAAYVANRDYDADPDREWAPTDPDGSAWPEYDGWWEQNVHATYTDSGAIDPHELSVTQESSAFSTEANDVMDDFVIVRYTIANQSPLQRDLQVGVFLDIDIEAYELNTGRVDGPRNLVYMTDPSGIHVGVRLLQMPGDPPMANLTLIHNPTYVWPQAYILDQDKYGFLAAQPGYTLQESPDPDDYSILASAGPVSLDPGESRLVAFAIVGGESLEHLLRNADVAQLTYERGPAGTPDGVTDLPGATCLLPSSPNPFHQGTMIRFDLARPGDVSLCLYDVAGRLVRRLAWGQRAAGCHILSWDSRDAVGRLVPAGVYFLRLDAQGIRESERIVRLR